MGRAIEVDRGRVNATGARMIRGLYFVETGRPLAPEAPVRVETKAGWTYRDPDVLEIARTFSKFTDRRNREVGSAFSYVTCFGHGVSLWLMLLYDNFFWLGTVDASNSN